MGSRKRARKARDQQELARRQAQRDLAKMTQVPGGQVQHTRVEQSFERYNGPLPHPRLLAQFEEVVPGAAERIIANMEREGDHRRAIELEESRTGQGGFLEQMKYRGRGQWMAFCITMSGLALSAGAIAAGFGTGGVILGGASLVAVIVAFISGGGGGASKTEGKPAAAKER